MTITNTENVTNNKSLEGFWGYVETAFSRELTPQQFKTWIKPLYAIAYDNDGKVLDLAAPNRFKLDWAKTQFNQKLNALAEEYFEAPIQLNWVLDPKIKLLNSESSNTEEEPAIAPQIGAAEDSEPSTDLPSIGIDNRSRLNPNLTNSLS